MLVGVTTSITVTGAGAVGLLELPQERSRKKRDERKTKLKEAEIQRRMASSIQQNTRE